MKFKSLLQLVGLLLLLSAPTAQAQTLKLTNNTSWDFAELYVGSADQWGQNLLSGTVAANGGAQQTSVACGVYDIKIVDGFGDVCIMRAKDICQAFPGAHLQIDDDMLLACQDETRGGGGGPEEDDLESWASLTQGSFTASWTLRNTSGYPIDELYASPSTAESWGAEVLNGQSIATGASATVYLDPNEFDLKFIVAGTEGSQFGLDLQDGFTLEFDPDYMAETCGVPESSTEWCSSQAQGEYGSHFVMRNTSGFSVSYIHIRPKGETDWGRDVLGDSEVLEDGEDLKIYLNCGEYDIRLDYSSAKCEYQAQLCSQGGEMVWEVSREMAIGCIKQQNEPTGLTWSEAVWSGQGLTAGYDSQILLENTSQWTIFACFVAPMDSESFGDDIFGDEILANGGKATINLKAGTYQVKLIDEDGDECIQEVTVAAGEPYYWTIDDDNHMECIFGESGEAGDDDTVWASLSSEAGFPDQMTFRNNSNETLYYLYVSPSESSSWGADVLGDQVWSPGQSLTVYFDCAQGSFDLKYLTEDDMNCTQFGMDLCSGDPVNITQEDLDACRAENSGEYTEESINLWAGGQESEYDSRALFINSSNTSIYYLYISPTGLNEWGGDVLGSEVISAGTNFEIGLNCDNYDLRMQDENGTDYIVPNQRLCGGNMIIDSQKLEGWSQDGERNSQDHPGFALVNLSTQTFLNLYVYGRDDENLYGADLLGNSQVLSPDQMLRMNIPCKKFNIRVVTDLGTYQFNKKKLCETFGITDELLERAKL